MSTDFERFIEIKKSLLNKQQGDAKKFHERYEQAVQSNARETRIESFFNLEQNALRLIKHFQAQLSLARPDSQADIEERKRIMMTYPDLLRKHVSEKNPLFFHGMRDLTSLEQILSSGHLGYLLGEKTRSFTNPGTVDVTTADSIETSIQGFTGLNYGGYDKFLPAGCLFVISPKDEAEREYANKNTGTEHNIETVDFKSDPNRIVAIVSTTENKERISELAQKYHIDPKKVYTFDGFIEHLSKQNPSKLLTTLKEEKEKDKEGRSATLKKVLETKSREGKRAALKEFHSQQSPAGVKRRTALKFDR